MTSEYRVHPGTDIIADPGKFEGECTYVPVFWGRLLEWGEQPDEYDVYRYDVSDEDRTEYPTLYKWGVEVVHMFEDEQGFVRQLSDYNPAMVEAGIASLREG